MNKLLRFMIFAAAAFCATHARAQVVVIAHPGFQSGEVSKSELRDVFSGSLSSFKEGGRVTPVLLKAGTTNDEFLAEYIGKPDNAFRAAWRSLVFSGQAMMPRSLDTDEAVVEYVARTPGAVAYISKSAPHGGVKVLAVR